jgi:hypothetical protein
MSYTYASLTTALAASLVVPETDADFLSLLPTIIDDAEQVCYRELDLVYASVTVNGTATANNRLFTLPSSSGHLLVIDQINTLDASNKRWPATPSSREVIDFMWPSDTSPSATSVPSVFARVDDASLLFGPSAGFSATVEVIGTIRPNPLSATNTTTFLSTYLSDLFFAACMVSATGNLLKNWAAVSDDPQMAITWKSNFNERLASCMKEELRKNYISAMSAPPPSLRP